MISVPVRDQSGNDVGTYEFDPAELAGSINKQLLHDVVVMYEANRRVGTVKTKSRGQVRGSTAKLYRQKGTGRARAGSARTPIRRGGGHAFAKRPLDWTYRLPKKAIKMATRMALLSKFLDGEATVLDGLKFDAPKTRLVVDMLKALGMSETTCLLAIDGYDANLLMSSRNIPGIEVSSAAGLNAYGLLHQRQLLVTREALDSLRRKSSAGDAAQG